MLIGKYYHTLEQKGRLSLPKKFRDIATAWIVTRGLDGGLFLFTQEAFDKELQVLERRSFTKKSNRDFVRLMSNEAVEVATDGNGRVQLPEYLISSAGLKKDIVVVGSVSRVEIWDRESYHTYIDNLETRAEDVAESFDSSDE